MLNQKVTTLLSRLNLWNNQDKETVQDKVPERPVFIGTKREFKRYVGPVLRNLVQQITRKHRKEIGHCQHCSEKENLQAAHVAGRNRNHIIEDLLKEHRTGNLFHVNLEDFERRFKEEHEPLEKSILILCKSCHIKYDAKPVVNATPPPPQPKKVFKVERTYSNSHDAKSAVFTSREFTAFKQMKIGRLVKATLPKLIKLQRIGDSEFLKLQDAQYSKIVFDVNYPVLKKVDERLSLPDNRAVNGYPRYYAPPNRSGDSRYLITSEWFDRNHENYLNWLSKYVQKG